MLKVLFTALFIVVILPTVIVGGYLISSLIKGNNVNESMRALAEQIYLLADRTRNFEEISKNQNIITLQQVNNVGYTFYLGQIDYPDAMEIGDDIKKEITDIIHKANFPKSLLDNLAIVIVNTLAANSNQYIKMSDKLFKVNEFSPDFVEGGGIFGQHTKENSIIFINKDIIYDDSSIIGALGITLGIQSRLRLVLTHELGRQIGIKLTARDWEEYYKLRKIPSGTPKYGQSWQLSPFEDFAEVYKYIYTDDPIRTVYGLLVSNKNILQEYHCQKIYEKIVDDYYAKDETEQQDFFRMPKFYTEHQDNEVIISDTELQNCRRNVLLNSEKHPEAYEFMSFFGLPYKSIVDQETRNFLNNIIKRLNHS